MNKEIKKAVAKHIARDISRVVGVILILLAVTSVVVGFFFFAKIMSDVLHDNFSYIFVVDGVLTIITTIVVSIIHYTDIEDYAYQKRIWGKILYPILNPIMLMIITMSFYYILHFLEDDLSLIFTRASWIGIVLTVTFMFKIIWYNSLNPINEFYQYIDDIIVEEEERAKTLKDERLQSYKKNV